MSGLIQYLSFCDLSISWASCRQGSSLSWYVSEFLVFVGWNNIPLYVDTEFCLSTHLSVDMWVSFTFSVSQFSRSVSLWPHGLQHASPPCPSPTPGVYSNSCPLSRWCHPTILSSVVPFSSCLQSLPASESSQMSQLFASDDQITRVSASTSVLPINSQDWFPLGWTG